MPAKVISFINLKGGVAKTTTTVGTAIALSEHFHKKVLVIDLDPQTNATTFLIGENRWKELDDNLYTLHTLFSDAVDQEHNFSLEKTVQHGVGNINDAPTIDLIPSSIRLVYIQDELYDIHYRQKDPFYLLEENLCTLRAQYDYILIDCPPNLGFLSLNGLVMSNGYIIPSIPDILSTYGIDQIINRIDVFARIRHLKVPLLGVVFTKVRPTTMLHTNVQADLRKTKPYPFFDTVFLENTKYASAAEFSDSMTYRQKWGGTKNVEPFYQFCYEIEDRLKKKGGSQ